MPLTIEEAQMLVDNDEQVLVHGSDYKYCGHVVSVFPKRPRSKGIWRAVVQDKNGRLFIHNLDQLERGPTTLGPMATAAKQRPAHYHTMSTQEQWEIDQDLGVLDWDGDPRK